MILRTILTRVIEQTNGRVTSSFDSTAEIKALEAINRRYKEMNYITSGKKALPWMTKKFSLITTEPVTTGTMTLATGDKTATHSGTSMVAGMVGRTFKANEYPGRYKIAFFSSSSAIELDQTYEGAGGSSLSYSIFDEEQVLPADFHTDLLVTGNNGNLEKKSLVEMEGDHPNDFTTGIPIEYALSSFLSQEAAVSTLTATTTTWTTGSRTVSGSGTSFSSELIPGDLIRKEVAFVSGTADGTLWRQVDNIASDTSLTLTQAWQGTTGTSTTAQKKTGWLNMKLWPAPDDEDLLTVTYLRWLPDLLDMTNIPEMPEYWHEGIIWGALWDMWEDEDDKRALRAERLFRGYKASLAREYGLATEAFSTVPIMA